MIDTLAQWARRLCHLVVGGRHEVFDVATYADHANYAEVSPPPLGVVRLQIFDDLATHTKVDHITAELAEALAYAELQARFGDGEALVRLHPDSPHVWCFRIEQPDAPCTVDLFVTFTERPTRTSASTKIQLRRNPSPASKVPLPSGTGW